MKRHRNENEERGVLVPALARWDSGRGITSLGVSCLICKSESGDDEYFMYVYIYIYSNKYFIYIYNYLFTG